MIHRYWTGDQPKPDYAACMVRVVELTQGEMPHDWDDDNLPPELLVPHEDPRKQANLVRLGLLWRFGGLWLDYDVIPTHRIVRDFTKVHVGLHQHVADRQVLSPAVLAAPPEHPLIGEALDALRAAPNRLLADVLTELWDPYGDLSIHVVKYQVDGSGLGATGCQPIVV